MNVFNDEAHMRLALQLAAQAQGQTGVNPMVGCVIIKDGRTIGLGAHLRMGEAHAEVHALQMAGVEAAGSTVYVTLEPCSHFGKTPPCVDRLIESKVKKVIIACQDHNPQVAGSGVEKLRSHGIQVEVGLLEQESLRLNEKFNKFIRFKLPFVTLKTASTLDGKIAAKTGDSRWITNERSRAYVHTLRHQHQAIMVGVETVISDNPSLSTRLTTDALQPIRLIVDSMLRIPLDSQVLTTIRATNQATMILTTNEASELSESDIEALGARVIRCGSGPRVNLHEAMKRVAREGMGSILLEGGGRLNGAMLEAKLIDKMVLFYAPKIIGGGANAPTNFQFDGFSRMSEAFSLRQIQVTQFGDDICLIGYPQYGGEEGCLQA